MPNSAARLNELGLWESRMLGMSRRTRGSTSLSLLLLAFGIAFALVIHADEIQLRALERIGAF